NRRTVVSKTRSMHCLRKRIGDPLGHVLVLGEGLTKPLPGHEGQAGMPAHVRMSWAARRMCRAGIVGDTQSSKSDAVGGAAGCCGGLVAARKVASAVQSHMSVSFVSTPCRRR